MMWCQRVKLYLEYSVVPLHSVDIQSCLSSPGIGTNVSISALQGYGSFDARQSPCSGHLLTTHFSQAFRFELLIGPPSSPRSSDVSVYE